MSNAWISVVWSLNLSCNSDTGWKDNIAVLSVWRLVVNYRWDIFFFDMSDNVQCARGICLPPVVVWREGSVSNVCPVS